MSTTLDEISKTTLALNLDERAELAARLLLSLDEPDAKEVEHLWEEESIQRLQAYRRGETQAIPDEEVFQRALAELS